MALKSGLAAVIALALATSAAAVSAGVVISQDVVVSNNTAEPTTNHQTVMIQGHKQAVITSKREFLTDLDAGTTSVINTDTRRYFEVPVGMSAARMVWEGAFIQLKNTGATDKVAGYACQDNAGSAIIARQNLKLTKCVASDAPGAGEFVEFQKAQAAMLKRSPTAPKLEILDGIPLSSSITRTTMPFVPPPGFPPDQAARLNAGLARYKPIISVTTVSKIEVKDLAADVFAVPAGYIKGASRDLTPHLIQGKNPAPPGAGSSSPASPPQH
jgi:hypothetical protein